jgi:hypothetical protein
MEPLFMKVSDITYLSELTPTPIAYQHVVSCNWCGGSIRRRPSAYDLCRSFRAP